MLELVLIVLIIVIFLGRTPAYSPADPIGLLVTILLIVLLVALISNSVGMFHWRY